MGRKIKLTEDQLRQVIQEMWGAHSITMGMAPNRGVNPQPWRYEGSLEQDIDDITSWISSKYRSAVASVKSKYRGLTGAALPYATLREVIQPLLTIIPSMEEELRDFKTPWTHVYRYKQRNRYSDHPDLSEFPAQPSVFDDDNQKKWREMCKKVYEFAAKFDDPTLLDAEEFKSAFKLTTGPWTEPPLPSSTMSKKEFRNLVKEEKAPVLEAYRKMYSLLKNANSKIDKFLKGENIEEAAMNRKTVKLTRRQLVRIIREGLGGPATGPDPSTIKATEIRSQPRRTNFNDEEEVLPMIQAVIGDFEISDPGQPNWDESKDQIVYLGSVTDGRGDKVLYFKTSQTGHYYMLPVS